MFRISEVREVSFARLDVSLPTVRGGEMPFCSGKDTMIEFVVLEEHNLDHTGTNGSSVRSGQLASLSGRRIDDSRI